jgi:hypothetical protein
MLVLQPIFNGGFQKTRQWLPAIFRIPVGLRVYDQRGMLSGNPTEHSNLSSDTFSKTDFKISRRRLPFIFPVPFGLRKNPQTATGHFQDSGLIWVYDQRGILAANQPAQIYSDTCSKVDSIFPSRHQYHYVASSSMQVLEHLSANFHFISQYHRQFYLIR